MNVQTGRDVSVPALPMCGNNIYEKGETHMRLRNRPGAMEKLTAHPEYVIQQPETLKGKWRGNFNNDNPVHIEIGTGKGQFIIEMAKQNPHVNFVGIELQTSVLLSVLEKQLEEELPNLLLLQADAANLQEYFEEGEVGRIYLNFSDPWPKNRHEKRRLTYKTFLTTYEKVLADDGEIIFKTDNQGLFEYSLVSFSEYGAKLEDVKLDLHHSDVEDNVMTEYEEKFSKKGNRIYRAIIGFEN